MKPYFLWTSAALLAIISGCHVTEPNPFAYDADPVARAIGARWNWEGTQHYDAAVVILRNENVPFEYSCDARMAFDVNNNPVQIDGAALNGVLLSWVPKEENTYHAKIYATQDRNAYGPIDSAKFSYTGYDGETWTETVGTAPDFGPLVTPDTVIISQGLTIHYSNPVVGDTIRLVLGAVGWKGKPPTDSVFLDTTLDDNGTITIPPSRLPQPVGTNGYDVQVSRFQFTSRTSPRGKVIGIYSETDAGGALDARP